MQNFNNKVIKFIVLSLITHKIISILQQNIIIYLDQIISAYTQKIGQPNANLFPVLTC